MQNRAVVFISGGCYDGFTANTAIDMLVFDWDNFNESPETYWDEFPVEYKKLLQQHEPETYATILEDVARCKKYREETEKL